MSPTKIWGISVLSLAVLLGVQLSNGRRKMMKVITLEDLRVVVVSRLNSLANNLSLWHLKFFKRIARVAIRARFVIKVALVTL